MQIPNRKILLVRRASNQHCWSIGMVRSPKRMWPNSPLLELSEARSGSSKLLADRSNGTYLPDCIQTVFLPYLNFEEFQKNFLKTILKRKDNRRFSQTISALRPGIPIIFGFLLNFRPKIELRFMRHFRKGSGHSNYGSILFFVRSFRRFSCLENE